MNANATRLDQSAVHAAPVSDFEGLRVRQATQADISATTGAEDALPYLFRVSCESWSLLDEDGQLIALAGYGVPKEEEATLWYSPLSGQEHISYAREFAHAFLVRCANLHPRSTLRCYAPTASDWGRLLLDAGFEAYVFPDSPHVMECIL
jgi:hypothetical protein